MNSFLSLEEMMHVKKLGYFASENANKNV